MRPFPRQNSVRALLALILAVLLPLVSEAQEGGWDFSDFSSETSDTSNSGSQDKPWADTWSEEEEPPVPRPQKEYPPLPRSFRDIDLGMGLENLKGALEKDNLFRFRGDRDVSFLPAREQSLVETTGPSYIKRAFFQLRDGEIFVMAYTLDPALVDHYSVFTSFVEKYGEPVSLNPQEAVWESETTRIAIERPLTVKYIDKTIFNDILDESQVKESDAIKTRKEFLDAF